MPVPRSSVRPVIAAGFAFLTAVATPHHGHAATIAAESLYVAGHFGASDSAFAAILARAPADTQALMRRAGVALLTNRVADARTFAARGLTAGATATRAHALIAESFYREDSYDSAAVHFRAARRESFANKLASFHGRRPNRISGPATDTLRFLSTDPLPIVNLWVNGVGPLVFLIDTGGSEIALDPMFADSVGARRFGSETGTFAGGQKRDFEHAAVDSVRLGTLTVHDVPARLLDTSRFSAIAGGRRVAGVLGTNLLNRFRFTLDYRAGALVLERRGASRPTASPGPHRAVVPFWMAGDHYLLARGALRAGPEVSWFLDTGLAGAAFTAPASTLSEASVTIADTTGFTGQGGGGGVRVVPFPVESIRIGPVTRTQLLGMLGPFPPTLEYGMGTRIAGMVSHAFFRESTVTFDFDRMLLVVEGGW